MPVITIETFIQAPIGRCFDLSRSIDLHTISTDQTRERAVAGRTSGMIGPGESVTWSAIHFGIRQQLESRILGYARPIFFEDAMVRGAFRSMSHQHYFKTYGTGTLMTDVFHFESPLGILGHIANKLILTSYLRRLLDKRNAVIKEYAESERWREVL